MNRPYGASTLGPLIASKMDRGSCGRMVGMLAFYANNPSSNSADILFCKTVWKLAIKQIVAGDGPFFKHYHKTSGWFE